MCESHDDAGDEHDASSRRATPRSLLLRVGRSPADPGARILHLPPSPQVLKRGSPFGIAIAELLGASTSPEGVASAAERVMRSVARVERVHERAIVSRLLRALCV